MRVRERDRDRDRRETGGRGSGSRPGTKKETEEQSTEVGTEEEEDEEEEEEEEMWGCVFLSFLFFLSFSFRLFKTRGFSFQNISGSLSLVLGRWTGDHPQEDLAKFGYMS